MASISSAANGTRIIQFTGPDGSRRTIRLGKVSKRDAETIKSFIERIIQNRIAGVPLDATTADWIRRIEDQLHDRIARSGLIEHRDKSALGPLIDEITEIASHTKKASTMAVYGRARRLLVEFFGEDRRVDSITEKSAAEFWSFLRSDQGLSENTARRMSGMARQFMREAIRRRIVTEDPFGQLSVVVGTDEDRQREIDSETIQRVIEACPDAEWRLLVGLARYGGLRVPSEPLALKWEHIDWAEARITVISPKTEHLQGRGRRVIPLFPELEPLLREAFEAAPEGAVHVIHRHRFASGNYATELRRIIKRAGIEPWPKLWHNLRATRQTELLDDYPAHVACRWIGNTPAVAIKHYAMVKKEAFDQATGKAAAAAPAVPAPAPAATAAATQAAAVAVPTAAPASETREAVPASAAPASARCKMRCSQRRTGGDTRTTEPASRMKKPLSGPPEGVRKGVSWAILDSNGVAQAPVPTGTYANRPEGALQNALQSVLHLKDHELLAVRGVIDAILARTDAPAAADT